MTTKISQHVIESGAITSSHLTNITTAHITEGSNLYHTTARARSAISVTGGFLSYDSSTGVLSHDGTPTFASINSTGNFTLDSAGVIYLDADGGNVHFQDGGTTIGSLSNQNQNFNIVSSVEDKDLIFKGNDGGTTITALTLDMSAGGDATFNSNLNTLGGITVGDSSADVLRFVGILKQGSGTGTTVIDASRNLTVNDAAVGGNLTVTGNLTVNGTQTILNTSTLTVDDKIITIADGASDAAAANESGINVDGASAQILYKSGNDRWEFNKEAFTAFGFMIGTTSTDVGLMRNSSGVFDFQAQSGRQISFSNVTNGEHVRIDADGDVGIGTTSPGRKLDVSSGGSDVPQIRASYDSSNYLDLKHNLINAVSSGSNDALQLQTAGTTGLMIDVNQNVGIGTTSPSELLHVKGTNGAIAIDGNGSSNTASIKFINDNERSRITSAYDSGGGGRLTFHTDTTGGSLVERVRIDNAGRLLAGTSSPGARLAHTFARTGAFAAEVLQQQTSAGASVLGLTYDGAAPNNTTDYFIYAKDTAGIKHLVRANGDGYFAGKVGIGTSSPAAKLHISGNSDVSDEDCMLIIDDVDGSAGSRIPAIMFRSNTGGTVTNQGRIRGTDTQGMVLSGSSALGDDLVVQSGAVGIGTASPNNKLTVSGSSNGINITGTSSFIRWNSGDMMIRNEGSYAMGFHTYDGSSAQVERMRIDSSGNVLISNTGGSFHSSVLPLIVGSGSGDEGMAIYSGSSNKGKIGFADAATDDSGSYRGYFQYDHSDDSLRIGTAGSERMRINSSGNVYITGSNDMRIKLSDSGIAGISDSNNTVHIRGDNDFLKLNAAGNGGFIFEENGDEHLRIAANGYTTFKHSGDDFGIQIRSEGSTRSGLVIDHPGTSTIMGSALVLASDDSYRLGTASYYHVRMMQNGDTYFGNSASTRFISDGDLRIADGGITAGQDRPLFTGANASSYSTSTNLAYTKSTDAYPVAGEALKARVRARAYTKYVHMKTNLTSENVMFFFRIFGYFYNYGVNECVRGGYTYQGGVIQESVATAYNTNSNFTIGDFYRSSSGGFLCVRLDVHQTGYTEGEAIVMFGSHSSAITRELQITDMQHRDDGNNAY